MWMRERSPPPLLPLTTCGKWETWFGELALPLTTYTTWESRPCTCLGSIEEKESVGELAHILSGKQWHH